MRPTPAAGLSRRTPDEAAVAVVDARAPIGAARALSHLISCVASAAISDEPDGTHPPPVRDALRHLVAKTRHASVKIQVSSAEMQLEGVASDEMHVQTDMLLAQLDTRLRQLDVTMLSIREGAAPGELLTLARLLAGAGQAESNGNSESRPTSSHELLRTWSVLAVAGSEREGAGSVGRIPGARTDDAATRAVDLLVESIDDLARRGDAMGLERVACSIAVSIEAAGAGVGRLALERGLRQLLRPGVIALLAERVPTTTSRAELLSVFARAGDAGVRALTDALMRAADPVTRRSYFDAIVSLDMGGSLLRDLLADERWFVVRNTAALLGEMGVTSADSQLVALLGNVDERIRIAVARALVRLRTPRALLALHSAIDDSSDEVRRIAATSYSIAASASGPARPTAARLAAALDRERDENVALEMMAAMGRLGSADAVQRLLRIAQSPTEGMPGAAGAEERGYMPRPGWVRIAALEALVDARGVAVASTVEALVNDEDELVAAAAKALRAR